MWPVIRAALCLSFASSAIACGSSSASTPTPPPDRVVVPYAVMRQDLLTGDGMGNGSIAYSYATSGNLERADNVGQAMVYTTFEYDPTGTYVVREKHYGAGDLITTDVQYAYDSDNVLSEAISYDGNGAMLSYETYVFVQGRKTSATLHAAEDHEFSFMYDVNGKRMGSTELVAGAVVGTSSWQYASSGAPALITQFAAGGAAAGSRQLETVPSGSNYDYFAFWDF